MYNISKIVVIVVIFLLVGSSAIDGYYWYRLDTARKQLTNTKVQLDNIDAVVQLGRTIKE